MNLRPILIVCTFLTFFSHAKVQITTVNNTPDEVKIQSDLLSLHEKYDLKPWIYTENVQVDENARTPHSHPVLTMSTQKEYLESQTKLLATYLHEQFHWHVIINGKPSKEAFRARIKEVFPTGKSGVPFWQP